MERISFEINNYGPNYSTWIDVPEEISIKAQKGPNNFNWLEVLETKTTSNNIKVKTIKPGKSPTKTQYRRNKTIVSYNLCWSHGDNQYRIKTKRSKLSNLKGFPGDKQQHENLKRCKTLSWVGVPEITSIKMQRNVSNCWVEFLESISIEVKNYGPNFSTWVEVPEKNGFETQAIRRNFITWAEVIEMFSIWIY